MDVGLMAAGADPRCRLALGWFELVLGMLIGGRIGYRWVLIGS